MHLLRLILSVIYLAIAAYAVHLLAVAFLSVK